MAIRTISLYNNDDTNFYHVERAGYITVSDMIFASFTDMINNGFNPVSVAINNDFITPPRIVQGTWPPYVQTYTIAKAGSGYRLGENVSIVASNIIVPLVAKITKIDNTSLLKGQVTDFDVFDPPEYGVPAPAQPANTVYFDVNTNSQDTSFFSGNFVARQGSVSSSAVVYPTGFRSVPLIKGGGASPSYKTPTLWDAQFGVNGSGVDSTGAATPANTWPTNTNTLWSFNKDITNVVVGSEIFSDDPSASIPAGTYITNSISNYIVNGIVYTASFNSGTVVFPETYSETRLPFTAFLVSANVTIPAGTQIKVRGRGLQFFSNTKPAESFTVTLEAGGGVDPLNDAVGVFGNVAQTTTNNNIVVINNINSGNSWKPVIYPGQQITSRLLSGSLTANQIVTVISANMSINYQSAVVTLSSNISFGIANEPVSLKFSELQPWRISANVPNTQTVNIYAATPIQLEDNGNIAFVTDSLGVIIDRAGALGAAPTKTGLPDPTKAYEGFINRSARVKTQPQAFPLNYALTITNRGIFLGVWEGSWSTLQQNSMAARDSYFNWFLIQRPVNKITGKILTTGTAPVFCVNSVGYKYYKFIVREADVLHPYQGVDGNTYRLFVNETGATPIIAQDKTGYAYRTPADAHYKDSFALLNTTNQIALTEDSKYLVSFLHNLTTPRFRYSEELDMIGQTSADVCMASNEISITAYQESGPRLYKALPANNVYNSGLRICVLKKMP